MTINKPNLHKPTKAEVITEIKDMFFITFGLCCYAIAWAAFMLPYQITTGGTTGIGAIVFYATGFPIQNTFFIINAILILFAIKFLGIKFTLRTSYSIVLLTFLLWWFQKLINDENSVAPLILGEGQEFMACIIGAVICGFGLGMVFNANGSTGGTDIIAAIVNKYKDVSLGRMIQICDLIIISSCYFVFYDLKRVIFGLVTLFIIGYVLDYVVNGAHQAVQFFIFSKEYEKIADHINHDTHRGVTVLDGVGWYKKQPVKVLVVMAYKKQSVEIFRLIKSIDPNAFVSQSAVIGVFGKGFNQIKTKIKKEELEKIEKESNDEIVLSGQHLNNQSS